RRGCPDRSNPSSRFVRPERAPGAARSSNADRRSQSPATHPGVRRDRRRASTCSWRSRWRKRQARRAFGTQPETMRTLPFGRCTSPELGLRPDTVYAGASFRLDLDSAVLAAGGGAELWVALHAARRIAKI